MANWKVVGAKCPKCGAQPCAEYAQMNQQGRWSCNSCQASGDLSGNLTIVPMRAPSKAPLPVKVPPKGLLRYVAIAFLAAAAVFAMVPLQAKTFTGQAVVVTFTEEECASATAFLMLMMNGVQEPPKRAVVLMKSDKRIVEACYAGWDEDNFLIIDDEGAGGTIPRVAVI